MFAFLSPSKLKDLITMATSEKIDAGIAKLEQAIAAERSQFAGAVAKAIAPLADEIAELKAKVAELATQVEAGSAAQATLAELESALVPRLEAIALSVDEIVSEPIVTEPEA
jgi:septal ring factor EnvC (AmiA/AmiB activator)